MKNMKGIVAAERIQSFPDLVRRLDFDGGQMQQPELKTGGRQVRIQLQGAGHFLSRLIVQTDLCMQCAEQITGFAVVGSNVE